MHTRITLSFLAAALALTATLPVNAGEDPTAELARSSNEFAIDLYRELAEGARGDNLFLSPASISSALAMAYAGARGDTAEEMRRAMHWTQKGDELHDAMAALTDMLQSDEAGNRLSIANALWAQQGQDFLDEFVAVVERSYDAGLRRVDFAGATEEARATINRWIEERTENRIRNFLAPGVLIPGTRLVLTNAVYFKGAWKEPFDEKRTRPKPFRLSGGGSVEVAMMSHAGLAFPYLEGDGFQALELPYLGEAVSMVVFLPDPDSDLSAFERRLTAEKIETWLSQLRLEAVHYLEIPRFKVVGELDLADTLGMPGVFGGDADFSGMTGKPDVQLSGAIHKAFVEVNERRTEAAAATALYVLGGEPLHFSANRPFFFVIRDRRSGVLLFVGRLTRPGEDGD